MHWVAKSFILACLAGLACPQPINLGTAIIAGLALKKAAILSRAGGGIGRGSPRRPNHRPGRRGGFGRIGRSVNEPVSVQEQIDQLLLKASIEDVYDCDKKFVCEVSTKDLADMDLTEKVVYELFGPEGTDIDVSDPSVEFRLAHSIGKRVGFKQCETIYARCSLTYPDILTSMETRFLQQDLSNALV